MFRARRRGQGPQGAPTSAGQAHHDVSGAIPTVRVAENRTGEIFRSEPSDVHRLRCDVRAHGFKRFSDADLGSAGGLARPKNKRTSERSSPRFDNGTDERRLGKWDLNGCDRQAPSPSVVYESGFWDADPMKRRICTIARWQAVRTVFSSIPNSSAISGVRRSCR